MLRRTRTLVAGTVAALLTLGASPALALQDNALTANVQQTPILVDAMLLRPMGLLVTAGGMALFALPAAFVALTRPTDLGKPFEMMVGRPFRYTFMDPLGRHGPGSVFEQ